MESIRSDPERFLGSLHDGTALHNVAYELVALSVMEALRQPSPPAVALAVLGPLRLRVTDAGRGMAMHTEPGQACSHAEHALTQFYPVPAPTEELRAFLTEWVWGARGSVGPVVVNALCESLEMVSVRGADRWCLRFERGVVVGPPTPSDTDEPSGTCITCDADPSIFTAQALDPARLEARLDLLRRAFPSLGLES